MSYARLVGFGEAMVRLASPIGIPFVDAAALETTVGGAELNALVAARHFGMPGTWVTALPGGSPLADFIRRRVAATGVAIHEVRGGGDRVGLYFLDRQATPRPATVHYDRDRSAFAELDPAGIDWASLLDRDSCLVVSGVSAAVGERARAALFDAVAAAAACGATVALDVNHRPSLWPATECYAVLGELLAHVDVLSASADDLAGFGAPDDADLGTQAAALGVTTLMLRRKCFVGSLVELTIIVADRTGSVSVGRVAPVVDPVGAGDAAFGAAVAVLPSGSLADVANAAADAAATCYSTRGDFLGGPVWSGDNSDQGVLR